MKLETTSQHWLVRSDSTQEQQVFSSLKECKEWAEKTRQTFKVWGNEALTFTVTKITERSGKL